MSAHLTAQDLELLGGRGIAMDVLVRRVDERFVEAVLVDVEDLGLLVIDPDSGVKGCLVGCASQHLCRRGASKAARRLLDGSP